MSKNKILWTFLEFCSLASLKSLNCPWILGQIFCTNPGILPQLFWWSACSWCKLQHLKKHILFLPVQYKRGALSSNTLYLQRYIVEQLVVPFVLVQDKVILYWSYCTPLSLEQRLQRAHYVEVAQGLLSLAIVLGQSQRIWRQSEFGHYCPSERAFRFVNVYPGALTSHCSNLHS